MRVCNQHELCGIVGVGRFPWKKAGYYVAVAAAGGGASN